jgi:large subunit ribosomal protein L23
MAVQDIIIRPILTEKAMDGIQKKKYTFEVADSATKIDIKNAVQQLFGVTVSKVNTLHVRGQMRRQGANQGYTRSWKKAVVTLTEESKTIEFFDTML